MKSWIFRSTVLLLMSMLILSVFPTVSWAASAEITSYQCSQDPPSGAFDRWVRHFEHNDATDSWDINTTKNYADGTQVALKPTFTPARTHMTFSFEVDAADTYLLVIQYYSTPDAFDRRICLQIDQGEKKDLSCVDSPTTDYQDESNFMYMIVPIDLTAGKHTFSVYVPMAYGETVNGQKVESPNLISYDLYRVEPMALYYQRATEANSDGTIDFRFLVLIDSLEYRNVGVTLQMSRSDESGTEQSKKVIITATTAYQSVVSMGETVTAASLGGKYLAAIDVKGINYGSFNHSFSVSGFVTEKDGTVFETETKTVTLKAPIKINETELEDFVIMKPMNTLITEAVTDHLCNSLKEAFATSVRIVDTPPSGKRSIRLEIDPQASLMHYGYRVENGDLILYAGGAYSMYRASRNLFALLSGESDRAGIVLSNGAKSEVSLLNEPEGLARAANSNLRLMSCNIMANGFDEAFEGWSDTGEISFEMRTEIFEAFLEVYDPDVIGLQEFCPSWYAYFESDLKNTAWKLSNASSQGSRPYFLNPILYRSDRYREVANSAGWVNYSISRSQGWGGRYMSWLALESIETGERFVLLDVHWDGWSLPTENAVQVQETLAKVKELQGKYNCQVMITGDFNTRDGTATTEPDTGYVSLLADGTLKDSKYYTQKLVNTDGSLHTWGDGAWARPYSFDHIFCTNGTMVRQFYTAWKNHQYYASDHAWLIADIDLTTNVSS